MSETDREGQIYSAAATIISQTANVTGSATSSNASLSQLSKSPIAFDSKANASVSSQLLQRVKNFS